MQFDPGLKQLLLQRTGTTSTEISLAEVSVEEVPVVARLVDPSQPVDGLRVVARFGNIVTARVSLGAIGRVHEDGNVASLKANRGFAATLARSVHEVGADAIALPSGGAVAGGRGVVVAVIDWGCDFVHANFRRADGGTRLLWLWDQRGDEGPTSPPEFGYGRQFDRAAIDRALGEPDPYAALDYDPADSDSAAVGTHGTHVLDIAAGNGRAPGSSPGVAPEADLIFVHLRGDDTLPTDTLGDSVSLLEAVRYVLDRAGDRPIVLNLSMGRHCGPHDGTLPLELAMDAALAERPGRAIVMSTGNYFDARVHTAGRVSVGETTELAWIVAPLNDETAELEVWYAGSDRFSLSLVDPAGRTHGPVALGDDLIVRDGETIIASVFHRDADPNNCDNHIEIFIWPAAPDGTWRIRLGGEVVEDGCFNAWIERDDAAQQSRFAADQAVRQTTTNTICNGHHTITVGAYGIFGDSDVLLPFSSSGPTRDGRPKPDVVAPGGGIRAARSSRIVGGQRTRDETTVKSGTSMASPHVAGTVALMFEAAAPARLPAAEVRAILQATARPLASVEEADRLRSGAGRLNARAAVEAVLALPAAPVAHAIEVVAPKPIVIIDGIVEAPTEPPTIGVAEERTMVHEVAPPPLQPARLWTELASTLPSLRAFGRAPSPSPSPSPSPGPMAIEAWAPEVLPYPTTRPRLASETSPLDWLARSRLARAGEALGAGQWLFSAVPRLRPRPFAETVRYRRKSLHALDGAETARLIGAVTGLYALNQTEQSPPGTFPRRWGRFADYHAALVQTIHGTISGTEPAFLQFLPWHRMFVRWFEWELQRVDPGVVIPYWDWTVDRYLPDWLMSSLEFTLSTPTGRSIAVDRSARAKAASAAHASAPSNHQPGDDRALPDATDVAQALALTSYRSFTEQLEYLHNGVHMWAGAGVALGNLNESPADFVFYLHHAQVDRIWAQWQAAHPGHPTPTSALMLPSGVAAPVIAGRTLGTIASVLDTADLEYDYV